MDPRELSQGTINIAKHLYGSEKKSFKDIQTWWARRITRKSDNEDLIVVSRFMLGIQTWFLKIS